MKVREKTIRRIREFNRFYMPKLGLLDDHYLGSECSPTEARVLFEVYEHDGCNAACIARALNIDKSYLSRIIRAHEKSGYLMRAVSQTDSRAYDLHLTETGMKRTEDFIQKSNEQIGAIIGALREEEYIRLTEALNTVTDILKECKGQTGIRSD